MIFIILQRIKFIDYFPFCDFLAKNRLCKHYFFYLFGESAGDTTAYDKKKTKIKGGDIHLAIP